MVDLGRASPYRRVVHLAPLILVAVGTVSGGWGLYAAFRAARPLSWLGCVAAPLGGVLVAAGELLLVQ